MSLYMLTLGSLATWRLSYLLHAEDGPGDVILKLRRRAGLGFAGRAMSCFYCTSVWIAAPIATLLAPSWGERALLWPALSGAAILLERVTARAEARALFIEEDPPRRDADGAQPPMEQHDVQLRQ